MIKIKNKKGSHVGMMLSFVIFITFLIFLFSITEPVAKQGRDKQELLDSVKEGLKSEVSDYVTTATIEFDKKADDCVKIPINGVGELNAIVKDVGKNVPEILEHSMYNEVEFERSGAEIVKVYYSKQFEEDIDRLNCEEPDESDYEIILLRTTKHPFEVKIEEIINNITESKKEYNNIKEKLDIPSGDNFGLSFEYSDGGTIKTNDEDVKENIYVKELPIQYVDESANIKPGFLRIKVW